MYPMNWIHVREHERGLLFHRGVFERLLMPGRNMIFDPLGRRTVEKVSVRQVAFEHRDLEVIVRSGALEGQAQVLDLKDHERALVWVDGRVESVRGPGLHALWTAFHEVRTEVVDSRTVRFEHPELPLILKARNAQVLLETAAITAGWVGLVFQDGRHVLRERAADVSGQEIMTADKVTLRLNALVTYRVADPVKAVSEVDDFAQALYRQAQLALRAVVGTRELDALLADKDGVARQLEEALRNEVAGFGLEMKTVGIRDIILPGEMKEILNRVTEARKAAEAALVTRREETAAIRSQANTARIFESNPTLMRLRELEVLEKVAGKANLSVIVGDGGLADRVVKLL
ncbi:MAG TPA: slipin family protein [Thermoanaerobaculia bacterium]|nr:slipin family protein [Thermoanaerobaculia bacterium]